MHDDLFLIPTNVGSEYRSWIIYYALSVMKGVLPPAYFNHLCLLVSALHILTSDYIPRAKLAKAEQALKLFYTKFSELYGNDNHIMYVACLCMCLFAMISYQPKSFYVNFLLQDGHAVVSQSVPMKGNHGKQVIQYLSLIMHHMCVCVCVCVCVCRHVHVYCICYN